jgi:ubiquitin carboxyl-terminal hydrolase 16
VPGPKHNAEYACSAFAELSWLLPNKKVTDYHRYLVYLQTAEKAAIRERKTDSMARRTAASSSCSSSYVPTPTLYIRRKRIEAHLMPDKPATVAAYAAGASLAAIALFYVFGPNFTIDGQDSSSSGKRKAIIGLSNPANDCFINSVLQALAGLGELRVYLIRELHRRQLEGPQIYDSVPDVADLQGGQTVENVRLLQQAPVTKALKEMLDRLNERPLYRKTISARPFILALEEVFRTRISRNQQDAHEFLQVVVERLCEEYHAGVKARQRSSGLLNVSQFGPFDRPDGGDPDSETGHEDDISRHGLAIHLNGDADPASSSLEDFKPKETWVDDYGFPLEGKMESQIVCQSCQFEYKPNATSFVNLTLQVPQTSSTSLSSCFDGLLKTEYIDEFRCDKCQLQFVLEQNEKALNKAKSEKERRHLQDQITLLKHALVTDPESPPEGIVMPDSKLVPRRRIARHMRITVFPKIIGIHLSRSMFDNGGSIKNAAKVSFPERIPLGSIIDRKWYRLLGIVCHKGSHHSGHYESFRRNHVYPPFSTPDTFRSYAQSRANSENPSTMPSPKITPQERSPVQPAESPEGSLPIPTPESSQGASSASASLTSLPLPSLSPSRPSTSPPPKTDSLAPSSAERPTSLPGSPIPPPKQHASAPTSSPRLPQLPSLDVPSAPVKSSILDTSMIRRKKRNAERWWRISDEKVKECKTSDVLGMQREVYLLFYELERPVS